MDLHELLWALHDCQALSSLQDVLTKVATLTGSFVRIELRLALGPESLEYGESETGRTTGHPEGEDLRMASINQRSCVLECFYSDYIVLASDRTTSCSESCDSSGSL